MQKLDKYTYINTIVPILISLFNNKTQETYSRKLKKENNTFPIASQQYLTEQST